jgi:hypothetical protein
MDKKLRKNILEVLKNTGSRLVLFHLKENLKKDYGYMLEGSIGTSFDERVDHILRVLEGDALIKKEVENPSIIGYNDTSFYTYFELTSKGYAEFKPCYIKVWNFINDDFTKLLSLVAIILSIIATIVSFSK